jgi:hypothetical protein
MLAILLHHLPVALRTLSADLIGELSNPVFILMALDPIPTLLQPGSFLFKLDDVGIWREIGPLKHPLSILFMIWSLIS